MPDPNGPCVVCREDARKGAVVTKKGYVLCPKCRALWPRDHGDGLASHPKVCYSAAGYYVGRMAWDLKDGYEEPGGRESGYFRTHADAEDALKEGFALRDAVENPEEWKDDYVLSTPH